MSKQVMNSSRRENFGGKKSGTFALFLAELDKLIVQHESADLAYPNRLRRMSTSSFSFGQITEMASPGSQVMFVP